MPERNETKQLGRERARQRGTSRTLWIAAATGLFGIFFGAYFHDPIARWIGTGKPADTESVAPPTPPRQLWTCSMHPQVIQDGPGLCPICHMQLAPLSVPGAKLGRSPQIGGQQDPSSTHDIAARERKIKYWWDPMLSPPYISDRPGKSPMGMDLIPVYEDEVSAGTAVTIDPAVVQNMGVRVAVVAQGPVRRSIRLFGHLEEPQPAVHDVNLRVSGWIQKLHADTEGMLLQAGDPLFDLYSPDLQAAIAELIIARTVKSPRSENLGSVGAETGETVHLAAARKLELLGLSREQVQALALLDRAPDTVTFASPAAGYLTEKAVVAGSAVAAGDRVMRIVDQRVLWLDTRAFEQHLPFIALGQKAAAAIATRPGETFNGEIIFISPRVDPMTRSAVVRFAVPNPSLALRPGMYATVNLVAELAEGAILVPREAIIDTGTRQIAFVTDKPGYFEPRRVSMGLPADDGMVQVLSGLAPGEHVVVSGQFLLDTESRLREAIQKYLDLKRPPAMSVEPSVPTPELSSEHHGMPGAPREMAKDPLSSPQADGLFAAYLELADRFGAVQQSDAPVDAGPLVAAANALRAEAKESPGKELIETIAVAAEALLKQPIDRQRELFKAVSEGVVKLAEVSPPSSAVATKVYIMHCPMAPGRWLQRTRGVANPFYAAEMKECGEMVKTIDTARRNGS